MNELQEIYMKKRYLNERTYAIKYGISSHENSSYAEYDRVSVLHQP